MRTKPLALVVLAASLAALPLEADEALAEALGTTLRNLVTNGSFDGSTAGWDASGASATLSHSTVDAGNAAGSGSIVVTNAASSSTQTVHASQCVAVEAGKMHALRLKARIPANQTRTGSAFAWVYWFPNPTCSGSQGAPVGTTSVTAVDSWKPIANSTLSSPAGSMSALVLLRVSKAEAGGQFRAHFDDVTFVPYETLTIPAAASIHGNAGTFFHNDLWVVNRSYANPITVRALYRCFAGQTCDSATKTFGVGTRRGVHYTDVVGTLFGSPETAGAIELTWDSTLGAISASSRVYTPSLPAPTTGAGIPARKASEALTRALFTGLGSSGGTLTSGFRSNAGAYNPNDTSATVTFTLYMGTGNGEVLGTPVTRTWEPREAYQVNDVFAAAGTTVNTPNVYLVVTATAPVFPYVTVIDNQSGDSIFVQPTEDEAP